MSDNKISRITNLPLRNETSPREDSNGENLILISDLNGINNIYAKDISQDSSVDTVINSQLKPITNSLTGLYQLSLSKDTKKLVFSSLYESIFNLFMLDNPFESKNRIGYITDPLYLQLNLRS